MRSETVVMLHRTPYIGPRQPAPASYKDSTLDGNWGDWLWKFAAWTILDQNRSLTCNEDRYLCLKDSARTKRIVHFQPFANDLTKVEWKNTHLYGAYEILEHFKDEPFLAIGLGMQAPFAKKRSETDLGLKDNITYTVNNAKLSKTSIKFLNELERRQQIAFFRGSFTNEVARKYGYTFGLAAGCPTLFINPLPRLGNLLQFRYKDVGERIGDRSLKIAFNSSPSSPLVTQLIVRLLNKYPNSLLFPQHAEELKYLESLGVPFNRVRVFNADVSLWMDTLKSMDVAFGPRIHGSMAAISAGIPAFIIAPDHRVLELSSTMMIPHTHIYDKTLLADDIDVAKIIANASFDGQLFDLNRCRLAKLYSTVFQSHGIHAARHMSTIAQQC